MDRRLLILAATLLTACANSPTAVTRGEMPVRFDSGGGWTGSGSYTGPGTRPADRSPGEDGALATSNVSAPMVGDSANTTGAGRGGGSFGSGN